MAGAAPGGSIAGTPLRTIDFSPMGESRTPGSPGTPIGLPQMTPGADVPGGFRTPFPANINPENVSIRPGGMAQTPVGGQPQNYAQQSLGDINQAARATRGLMNFQPTTISAGNISPERIQAERIAAGQLSETNLDPYMNPFTSRVVETSLADLERQRQMQQQQGAAQAARAGAFGGSRQGVAESLTNEAFARQAAQTSAGLRQAGFTQAQQQAQQDIQRRLEASRLNQATGLQASLANQQTGLQAAMANQQAALEAARLNQAGGLQGAQFRLGAAQQLGGLGQDRFGMGQTIESQIQGQEVGQQVLTQDLIDKAREQFLGYAGAPAQGLGYLSGALGAAPGMQTQTNTMQPGLFDYLAMGAFGAANIPGLNPFG